MIGYETRAIRSRHKTARDAFHERQRRRASGSLCTDDRFQLKNLFSRDELFQTARFMQENAGPGAGPDGIRPRDLTPGELGKMAGALAELIETDNYWLQSRLSIAIPKPAGGTRTLRIPTFADRVVARRLKDALERLIEPLFVETSFGFRPRSGVWHMLARFNVLADRYDRFVFAVADVKRAFDSVVIEDILIAFAELFEQTEIRECSDPSRADLLCLIVNVLRGGELGRNVGIDSGCPFSPFALNVLLHSKHDLLFMGQTNKPFWVRHCEGGRYADNLIYAARNVTEGRRVLDNLCQHFLRQDLPLKDDAQVYDLRSGAKAPMLGFLACCQDGRLHYELPDTAVDWVSEHLDETHDKPDPAAAAYAAVAGTLAWIGPALENGRSLLPQITRSLHHHGYRDVCSRAALQALWEASCQRWRKLLADTEVGEGV
jgi:hypothetical protein